MAVVLALEDAPVDETGECLFADALSSRGHELHPVTRIALGLLSGDMGQRGIQQAVADRRRVDQHELLQIGVDPILHRQIHEHRASDHPVERALGHVDQLAVVVSQQQEQYFLGESQHGPDPTPVTSAVQRRTKRPRHRSVVGGGAIQLPSQAPSSRCSGATRCSPQSGQRQRARCRKPSRADARWRCDTDRQGGSARTRRAASAAGTAPCPRPTRRSRSRPQT